MAIPKLADRVKETTSTTGTGTLTLAGAVAGWITFLSAIGNTATFYAIQDASGNWETGIGTLSGGTSLSRDTILASSNAGAAVNFGVGSKDVWIDLPASRVGDVLLAPPTVLSGAVSSVDFTGLTSTYEEYVVRWRMVTPSTDGSALQVRLSVAASFLSANYSGGYGEADFAGSGIAAAPITAAAQIAVTNNIGNTSPRHSDGEIFIRNPADTTMGKFMDFVSRSTSNGGNRFKRNGWAEYTGANSAIDGIRFLMSAGNIAAGTFSIWGRRTAA